MIIPEDKKRIATIMSSRRSDKGEPLGSSPLKPEVVKTEDGEIDGRHMAAQDMLHAMHEKSAEKMMRAMANFHDLHMIHKSTESQEE